MFPRHDFLILFAIGLYSLTIFWSLFVGQSPIPWAVDNPPRKLGGASLRGKEEFLKWLNHGEWEDGLVHCGSFVHFLFFHEVLVASCISSLHVKMFQSVGSSLWIGCVGILCVFKSNTRWLRYSDIPYIFLLEANTATTSWLNTAVSLQAVLFALLTRAVYVYTIHQWFINI